MVNYINKIVFDVTPRCEQHRGMRLEFAHTMNRVRGTIFRTILSGRMINGCFVLPSIEQCFSTEKKKANAGMSKICDVFDVTELA